MIPLKTTICSFIFLLFLCAQSNGQGQKIEISSDGMPLNAYFFPAEGNQPNPIVIWCHGNPGGKVGWDSKLADALNKYRMSLIRFNYRGLWGTKGVFKLSNSIEDLARVLDFVYDPENTMRLCIDTPMVVVAGYSYGTSVAMVSAHDDPRIRNLFCLGIADHNQFYFTPESLKTGKKKRSRELHQYAQDVLWGPDGNFDEIKNEFNLDIMRHTYAIDFVSQADKLKEKNILIVVGINDLMVPIEYHFLPLHRRFVELAHDRYSYKILESDHQFKNLKTSERAQMIASLLKK